MKVFNSKANIFLFEKNEKMHLFWILDISFKLEIVHAKHVSFITASVHIYTDRISLTKGQSSSSQGKNIISGSESSHSAIVSGHVPLAGRINGANLHQSLSQNLPLAGDLTDRNCKGPTCSAKNRMHTGTIYK